jgi:hypothetical protein
MSPSERRGAFRVFEAESDRLERSKNLDFILRQHGVDEPSVEMVAAITRWADAHVSAGLDAIFGSEEVENDDAQ